MRARRSLAERFWSRVDKGGPVPVHRPELGPCWVWTGSRTKDGYGKVAEGAPGNGWILANRVAFFVVHGRWPNPHALHACDNRACCKAVSDASGPAHIFEGTQSDNIADMDAKGRRSRVRARGVDTGHAKLTDTVVSKLRAGAFAPRSQRAIAKLLGVTPAAICRALKGRTWRHVQ